jgi:hypothetical protein
MDISKDKAAKYLGTALVSIAHLTFPHPCRQIDRKVIEQLKRDFEGEGCLNEDISNGVPVMIDNETFHAGLEKLAMTAGDFKAASKTALLRFQLNYGTKLECLHGQHRVLAAKEFLSSARSWWSADLYGTGRYNVQFHSMLTQSRSKYGDQANAPRRLLIFHAILIRRSLSTNSYVPLQQR